MQDATNNGNIDSTDAALIKATNMKNIDKFIKDNHRYSIFQRNDGRYQTRVGKSKQIMAPTREALNEKLIEHYSGKTETLATIYPEWIEFKGTQHSSKTVDRYKQFWNKHLEGTSFVQIPISELKAKDWAKFSTAMVGNQRMKKKCFKSVKSIVSQILDYAVVNDMRDNNFLSSCKDTKLNFMPEEKDRSNDCYTIAEKKRLLQFLKERIMGSKRDRRYAAAVILQLTTGIRVGELKALHWSDYYTESGSIYVHRSVVLRRASKDAPEKMVELSHTKGKQARANREIPLVEDAIEALAVLHEIAINQYDEEAVEKGDALVFCNEAGGYIDTNRYNRKIHRFCDEAGITDHTSHDSRRYVISKLLNDGVDAYTVQQLAGHLDFKTTEGYERDIKYSRDFSAIKSSLA